MSDQAEPQSPIVLYQTGEAVHNPDFNSGEFSIIRSQAELNSYKLSVKEWVEKTNAIAIRQMQTLTARHVKQLEGGGE